MEYLFERLYDPARRDPSDRELDPREAVRDQVQRLAWTCAGRESDESAYVVPFGMPSVIDIGADAMPGIGDYALGLRRLIERHEPRLRRVEVAPEAGRLVVSGVLAGEADAMSFAVDLAQQAA